MSNNLFIHSLYREMGEVCQEYTDLPGIEKALEKMGLASSPHLAGLGNCYSTENIYSVAAKAVQRTLASASGTVDAIVVFSSCFRDGFDSHNAGLHEVLQGIASTTALYAVCGTGCASVINALNVGSSLIKSGNAGKVLFVGYEALAKEESRILDYALVSDAAVSFIMEGCSDEKNVAQSPHPAYEVVDISLKSNVEQMIGNISFAQMSADKKIKSDILDRQRITNTDLSQCFTNNTFLPIKRLREVQLGVSASQSSRYGVVEFGHALSCDSLITLHDADKGDGELLMLLVEAVGHVGAALLRARVN